MKQIKYILAGLSLIVFSAFCACVNDTGNYTYDSLDKVKPGEIGGLNSKYTFSYGSTVKLEPEIDSSYNDNDYAFTWYMYERAGIGQIRDTIGRSAQLEFKVSQEMGEYDMLFEIRNKRTNVYTNKSMIVTIIGTFSEGWFVVEDDMNDTDVDFISLVDSTVVENIVYESIGRRISGEARKIVYNPRFSFTVDNPDGTVTPLKNQKVFFILTKNDLALFNNGDMTLLRSYEEHFFELPSVKDLTGLVVSLLGNTFLTNFGKQHFIGTMNVFDGKFGYPVTGLSGNNYALHPDALNVSADLVVFDTISRSFMQQSSSPASTFKKYNEATSSTTQLGKVTNMDKQLVRLLSRQGTMLYAIMKGAGKHYILDLSFSGLTYPIKKVDTIPAGFEILTADLHAAHRSTKNIYFAKDNKLWYHEVSENSDPTVREKLILTFPSDEKISFIKHFTTSVSQSPKLDNLVVLTNNANGWKLYSFPLYPGTPEFISSDLIPFAQGKGNARYCMRMQKGSEISSQ